MNLHHEHAASIRAVPRPAVQLQVTSCCRAPGHSAWPGRRALEKVVMGHKQGGEHRGVGDRLGHSPHNGCLPVKKVVW